MRNDVILTKWHSVNLQKHNTHTKEITNQTDEHDRVDSIRNLQNSFLKFWWIRWTISWIGMRLRKCDFILDVVSVNEKINWEEKKRQRMNTKQKNETNWFSEVFISTSDRWIRIRIKTTIKERIREDKPRKYNPTIEVMKFATITTNPTIKKSLVAFPKARL